MYGRNQKMQFILKNERVTEKRERIEYDHYFLQYKVVVNTYHVKLTSDSERLGKSREDVSHPEKQCLNNLKT